jgi:hypothetical protein
MLCASAVQNLWEPYPRENYLLPKRLGIKRLKIAEAYSELVELRRQCVSIASN